MNPTDEYSGTKELNKAFKSRFQMILKIEYPDNNTESDIIKLHVPEVTPAMQLHIISVANKLREAKSKEEVFYTCSTRDLIQWAKLTTLTGDLAFGFKSAVLLKANGDGDTVFKVFEAITGKSMEIKKKYYVASYDDLAAQAEKLQVERNLFESETKNECKTSGRSRFVKVFGT